MVVIMDPEVVQLDHATIVVKVVTLVENAHKLVAEAVAVEPHSVMERLEVVVTEIVM